MLGEYKPRAETVLANEVTLASADWIAQQTGGVVVWEIGPDGKQPGVNVPTRDGPERASLGSYVVRHPDGLIEIMTSDDFNAKYEEA